MISKPGFAYIWEYRVRPGRGRDFEEAYGAGGPWVALFERAPGYRRTELYRIRRAVDRYLTIDYWVSREAWQAFRETFSAEFEALDARCEELTIEEREIAQLDPMA